MEYAEAVDREQRRALRLPTEDESAARDDAGASGAAVDTTAVVPEPAVQPRTLDDLAGLTITTDNIELVMALAAGSSSSSSTADPVDDPIEPGFPSVLGGGDAYKGRTSRDDVIRTPPWATPQTNEALDAALWFNPDGNHAKWTSQLLGLKGWTLKAYKLTSDGETDDPDDDALKEAREWSRNMFTAYGGGIDAMLAVAHSSIHHRGAAAPELDVSDSRDDVLEVDFLDPTKVNFEVVKSGKHRRIIPMWQKRANSTKFPFNPATFCYFGHGVNVGQPYGQSPVLPLVETVPRQKELRTSLQRVAKKAGFAKVAWMLGWERTAKAAPKGVVELDAEGHVRILKPAEFTKHMDDARERMFEIANKMYEDDLWVGFDLARPDSIGADHSKSTLDFGKLTEIFDGDSIIAAHGQPAVHGRNWGSDLSSTGQVQWQVMALGIEATRDLAASSVEFIFNAWARIRGIPAYFVLEFPEIQKSERKSDAEAEEIETRTKIMQRDENWITNDEAAMDVVGHEAVGEPEPAPEPKPEPVPEPEPDNTLAAPADGPWVDCYFSAKAGCECKVACEHPEHRDPPSGNSLADAFEPEDTDVASAIELVNAHRFGDDDLDNAIAEYRKLARRITPQWADLLEAVEVREDALDDEDNSLAFSRVLAPRPRSEWKSDAWQWDSRIARYRYAPGSDRKLGRIVPQDRVRRILGLHLAEAEKEARGFARALVADRISPREFQLRMADLSAHAHMQARVMAVGGRDQATMAVRSRAWDHYRQDMRYLGEFGQKVARGDLSAAQIKQRSQLYVKATVTNNYEEALREITTAAGYKEERWVLGPADHCPGCVDQAGRSWVSIGQLPDIGTQPCRMGCACHKQQRFSAEAKYPPLSAPVVPLALPESWRSVPCQ